MPDPRPAVLAALLSLPAHAQDATVQGLDAHGFQLAAYDGDLRDPMAVHRPGRLQQWSWFTGGVLEYVHAPLVWVQDRGFDRPVRTPALDHLVALNLSLGLAVHERVRVDAALPLYFGSVDVNRDFQGVHFGDLRLTALALILPPDPDDQGLGLGASAHLDVPTGATQVQLGQRTVAGGLRVHGTYGWPRWTVGGELGVQINPTITLGNLSNPDQLLLGATAGYLFLPTTAAHLELRVLPALQRGAVAGTQTPAELLASVRHRFTSGAHLSGGLGTALSPGVGAARLRLFIGGGFGKRVLAPPRDRDHDGVLDEADACPDEPEDLDQINDQDGCPDHTAWLAVEVTYDGARLHDVPVRLTSPSLPAVETLSRAEPVEVEVPEGSPWLAEARSACLFGRGEAIAIDGRVPLAVPVSPRLDAPVQIDVRTTEGKPVRGATLTWQSLAPACVPSEPLTLEGAGITLEVGAGEHQLLVQAEGYGVKQAVVQAIPGMEQYVLVLLERSRVRVEAKEIVILERVYFDTDRATIRPESFPLLNEVAALLNAHPELGTIEVAGHTDNTGSATHNQELSEARANAVRAYLESKAVDPKRLRAAGYGESAPLTSNDTEQGRDKNRRVEFRRLDAPATP